MTRNANKLPKKEENDSEENKSTSPPRPNIENNSAKDNPFGLSFVLPTEMIDLPSKGAYYAADHPLSGVERLEIKFMTAKQEDILASPMGDDSDLLFDKLANSLICDSNIRSEDLLEDDKMAILLQARITGYGENYTAKANCTKCGEFFEADFDLKRVSVEQPSQGEYDAEKNIFRYTLPVTKIEVELKNINLQDERALKEDEQRKKKLKINFSPSESFLNLAIISANNVSDRTTLRKLIEVLPAGDVKSLKSFYSQCHPRMSLKQDIKCTNCGHVSEREAPLTWAFFRTDL